MVDTSLSSDQNLQARLSSCLVMKEEHSSDEVFSFLTQGRKLIQEVLDITNIAQNKFASLHSELQQLEGEYLDLIAQIYLLRAQAHTVEPPATTEEPPILKNPVQRFQ